MGLLDYYRQFEGLTEAELGAEGRRRSGQRRRHALERVEQLDLSQTTWGELPHPHVVNAVTYAGRRGLHRYPRRLADELRSELAHRHDVEPRRLAIGHGAAELLSAAARALIGPGRELVTWWPAYPLFPRMARRAGGRAVPVATPGVDALLAAVSERTSVLALARPADPTGELVSLAELERLLHALPEHVAVLLDEALVDFIDSEPVDAALALLGRHPRMLAFRSFSKAWGLAGLRCGYAIGAPGSEALLEELEPELGLGDLAQAGALESLRSCSELVRRRAGEVARERGELAAALRERGLELPDSQANFLWVAHPQLDGGELAARLKHSGIIVAGGGTLGDETHVRLTVRDARARDRVLSVLDGVL